MKYNFDKQIFSEEKIVYFENIEHDLCFFINRCLAKYPNLGITPFFEVINRKESFLLFDSNAGFSIENSLAVFESFKNYSKKKIKADIKECSLLLKLMFRDISAEDSYSKSNISDKKLKNTDDDIPVFLPITPLYDFEQIILPPETKTSILNNLNIVKNQDLIYKKWGFEEIEPHPRSILSFYGPAGTGKTMCAHAIAKFLERPLLAFKYSEIESKYLGDSVKNLKKAFETAKELNAVMFFDEADSFLGKRIENVRQGADQALNSLRSQMLILLEEFSGVVLFATNLVSNFDKAFESRILAQIKFDLPNKEARAAIIKAKIPSKLPLEHKFTEEEYLSASDIIDGFSGREIKNAVLKMLLDKAGKENSENAVFSFKDLTEALSAYKSQIEQVEKEKNEKTELLKAKIAKKLQSKTKKRKR